ncbi:hypothetical protein BO83DRAFT_443884 [Aspergillus eucalypticola CBS 122712]|uniref:Uncharacterized protein n=1 Tax=Aspergillus eucalypticola (strain CBS 122712 / IBT 29274) TaxID=1448314 RepID=A0A317VKJ2_ASPEC|nr:uncharacterized protein BO83DRAFT_443884 [Aspergillus eucalypticola CBS 122712]PWY74843.1 hypothetical protein BO83DRAFT_443884 [Aspergillus eucalypticola CBS 122712]
MPDRLKRKATDDPQCPSVRPRGHFRPQPTIRWSIEPNSIESILRDNSRDRLYVPPVAWTLRHLRLLGCRFTLQTSKRKERPTPQLVLLGSPVHNLRRPNLPADLRRAMLQFGGRRTSEVKKTAIKETVGAYGFSRLSHSYESLSFNFRLQPIASVWTEGVFSRNSTGPSLAYVTFDGIQSRRSKFVHSSPGKGFNEPVFRTCDKKLRSLQPEHTVEDPYIMGILIALAQEQRRHRQRNDQQGEEAAECSIEKRDDGHITNSTSSGMPPRCGTDRSPHYCGQCLRVTVLATSGVKDECLYVYTASISVAFLGKFDEPWRSSPSPPVVIEYYPISLRSPTKSLNKLHRVLCAEPCHFCAGDSPQALC